MDQKKNLSLAILYLVILGALTDQSTAVLITSVVQGLVTLIVSVWAIRLLPIFAIIIAVLSAPSASSNTANQLLCRRQLLVVTLNAPALALLQVLAMAINSLLFQGV